MLAMLDLRGNVLCPRFSRGLVALFCFSSTFCACCELIPRTPPMSAASSLVKGGRDTRPELRDFPEHRLAQPHNPRGFRTGTLQRGAPESGNF
jgi:hypothetical protein